MNCVLCQPLETDQVCSTDHWRVIVNYDQNKLGKCMIVLKRHDEDICNLTEAEVRELWATIRKIKAALVSCFHPDHFNYAFLMNQDAHVHLHVMPRYRGIRMFVGLEFQDKDDIAMRRLPEQTHQQIVTVIREALSSNLMPVRLQ